jgi:hypothetical protein
METRKAPRIQIFASALILLFTSLWTALQGHRPASALNDAVVVLGILASAALLRAALRQARR